MGQSRLVLSGGGKRGFEKRGDEEGPAIDQAEWLPIAGWCWVCRGISVCFASAEADTRESKWLQLGILFVSVRNTSCPGGTR